MEGRLVCHSDEGLKRQSSTSDSVTKDNDITDDDITHNVNGKKNGSSFTDDVTNHNTIQSDYDVTFTKNDTHDDVTEDVCDVTVQGPAHSAPDGGWGWVVLAAAHLSLITVGIQFASFSVVYVTIAERFDADRGVVGFIGSLYNFSGNVLGFIIGAFVRRFGSRTISTAGGIVGAIGIALSSMLVNVPYLYVTYGIIGGVGNALTFIATLVIMQQWFHKRRALAIGIGTFGMSLGSFLGPLMTNALLNSLGLGGTYLIMAGIWLQNVVLASLYRPVQQRSSSSAQPSKSIWKDIKDCSPLRNLNLILFLIGTFLTNIGAISAVIHFMSRAIFYGTPRGTAIILQSVMSVGTGAGRILFSVLGNLKRIHRVSLYSGLIAVDTAVVLSIPVAKSVPLLAVYGVVHGTLTGGFNTLQQTVVVDVGGIEHIAKTTGVLNMVFSSCLLLGIPLTGFVYDVTGSYDIPYVVVGTIQCCGAVILLVTAVLHRRQSAHSVSDP